ELLEAVGGQVAAVHAPRRTIGVRETRAVDLGGRRAEALAQGLVAAVEGEAEERAAVKAVVERDHRPPPRVAARELDRVLDRLGAAIEEDGLLGAGAGDRL